MSNNESKKFEEVKSPTVRVRFYDIKWDKDKHRVDLPKVVVMDVDSDLDLETEGADELSDEHGYCVFGFNYEIVESDYVESEKVIKSKKKKVVRNKK